MKRSVLLLLLAACSSAEDDTVVDASLDQSQQEAATKDGTVDAKPDTSPDVQQDVQADVSEAGDEAAVDASEEDASTPDVVVVDAPIDAIIVDAPIDVVVIDGGGGCSTNSDCAISEFCDKGTGNCGGKGACKAIPTICPFVILPVCGCDKQTYNNSCFANKGRASVDYTGACE